MNDKHLNNPLISHDFKIIVNKMTDKTTFSHSDGVLLHKEFYFERERCTKLYINSTHRKLINLLSNNAKCLLYWIFFELDINKDYLKINQKRYLKENNIKSVNTYKNAIIELCDKLIICPSPIRDVYFINPRLFFSGSRLKVYKDNLQVYKPVKRNTED